MFAFIDLILYYLLFPSLLLLLAFIIIIGFERCNLKWFSIYWKYCIAPKYNPYFINTKNKLFKDIDNSSDPKLIKLNSIRILEVGAGTGPNFSYYPKNSHLITVDKNGNFLETLLNNASKFPHITVENSFVAKGEDMKGCIEDNYCDVVVLTHILCSADDHIAILKEAYRVLKKCGTLYILEHVRYRSHSNFKIQRLFEPIWRYVNAGCHITRNITEQNLKEIGFRDVDLDYFELEFKIKSLFDILLWFVAPNIVGKAYK